MPFPGDREYTVSISYFEEGKLRGYETPVWAKNAGSALNSAERLLHSRHPGAVFHRATIEDDELAKMAKPRLISG